ncbi:unnamed protein product [Boreogadus saida]
MPPLDTFNNTAVGQESPACSTALPSVGPNALRTPREALSTPGEAGSGGSGEASPGRGENFPGRGEDSPGPAVPGVPGPVRETGSCILPGEPNHISLRRTSREGGTLCETVGLDPRYHRPSVAGLSQPSSTPIHPSVELLNQHTITNYGFRCNEEALGVICDFLRHWTRVSSPDPDLWPAPRWGGVLGGRGVHHTSHLPPLAGKEFHDVMAVSRVSKRGRVQHLSP